MKRQFKRSDRVAGEMLRELSRLVQMEVKDPRMPKLVTITRVEVTSDLSHAKVFYSVLDGDVNDTQKVLTKSASFLRSAIAQAMKLRIVPQLHFKFDEDLEQVWQVQAILANERNRDKPPEPEE